jgi:hypothetical protein
MNHPYYMNHPYARRAVRGYGAFGAVPMDDTSEKAGELLQALDQGDDAKAVTALQGLDTATRAAVCQRAADMLALPPCSTGSEPEGSCIPAGGFTQSTDVLKQKLATVCASAGGMSTTTKMLLIGGGAVILLAVLYKASKK